ELGAELKARALSKPDGAEHRQRDGARIWPRQDVVSAVTERAGRRLYERRRIEPLFPAPGEAVQRVAHLLRPLRVRRAVANVALRIGRDWKAAADRQNGVHVPVAQYFAQ